MPNLFGLVVFLYWPAGLAAAGELHAEVTDEQGRKIPGVQLILSCESSLVQVSMTDKTGLAVFLQPGSGCRLEAAAVGFAPEREVVADGTEEVSMQLRASALRTEVTVSAASEVVPERADAQSVLSAREIGQVPVLNQAVGLSEILTRTTPGVAADANGFAHPLGEHADTSISLDGQPITDQQAKIFANQIDPNTIQTMVATTGIPAAEFGGKTSLTVEITTKSGLQQRRPTGSISSEVGNFGNVAGNAAVAFGTAKWGNFAAVQASGSRRFLDTPEFQPLHAQGNNSGAFDRWDFQPTERDAFHGNAAAGRSWFQTPNSHDTAALGQDQRSQIRNVILAAGWSHVLSPELTTFAKLFYRGDRAQYFPSGRTSAAPQRWADQPATLAQDRTLRNFGVRADLAWVHGVHSAKLGTTVVRTRLHEKFSVGLTDPLYNAPCLDATGAPSLRCGTGGAQANPEFLPRLLPYDLSRGGQLYRFDEAATIGEQAVYLQDEIRWRRFLVSGGLRYDRYNGLSRGRQLGPRLSMGWYTPGTHTLLRWGYARLFETPYNENLIFANDARRDASDGGAQANPFGSFRSEPVRPGVRNQFHTGLEQRIGRKLAINASYYWKFTENAFDFDTLFNTPITFSVAWRKSKIDGWTVQVKLLESGGFSAYTVMGHVRSRFFSPEVGGLLFNSPPPSGVFRIDHGEEFEQTTQVRYQWSASILGRHRPWVLGVWRFNSGLALPDTVPTYRDALLLGGDEQAQIGLRCGSMAATVARPIRSCSEAQFHTERIRIPPPGTYNDDLHPVRVAARNLLDFSVGDDHLWGGDRVHLGARVSVVNATNTVALYNFLSTFSGTHFVPPRTYQASLQVTF